MQQTTFIEWTKWRDNGEVKQEKKKNGLPSVDAARVCKWCQHLVVTSEERLKQILQLPGPEVITLFSCSTQLSTKFILLINVKMPTIVGILTFISMINTTSERLKARNFLICWYFSFYEQLKFRAQSS